MACSSCAKKNAARTVTHTVGAQQKITQTGINTVQSTRYEQRVYVGPEANLESLLPGLSYGVKRPGQLMYVARQDLDAFPELFMTREDWINKLDKESKEKESKKDDTVNTNEIVESVQEEATKEVTSEEAESIEVVVDTVEVKPKSKKSKETN